MTEGAREEDREIMYKTRDQQTFCKCDIGCRENMTEHQWENAHVFRGHTHTHRDFIQVHQKLKFLQKISDKILHIIRNEKTVSKNVRARTKLRLGREKKFPFFSTCVWAKMACISRNLWEITAEQKHWNSCFGILAGSQFHFLSFPVHPLFIFHLHDTVLLLVVGSVQPLTGDFHFHIAESTISI